ncbi:MAG: SPOR domain-containing protein [Ignavibacteriales bacterium]
MSDPHRGAYTPSTDDPLTFDARRPAAAGGRRPFPWALAISILALLIVIGAVFYFYRSGVRAPNGAPQPVGTPVGSITAPAPAEAQPQDPAAGLEIYKAAQAPGTPAAPTFAPAPEQPQPRPTTPVQAAALPAAQPAPAADDEKPTPQVYMLNGDDAPTGSQTTALNNTAPAKLAPVKPAPAPKPAPVPTTVTPGNFVVQIGAVSSTALANAALAQAASIAGGGHGKSITPVTVNGATLYRTAVTGFTTKEAAIAYCNKLKAAGKSCFVR